MDRRAGLMIGVFIAVICVIAACAYSAITLEERGAVDEGEEIGVVVTILPQADFVNNVGGDRVRVTVMVPPGASPHTYAPKPGQLQAVSRAKVYFTVGSEVEFESAWMDKLLGVNPDMLLVDCADGITLRGTDPHIWNSPVNARVMVEHICTGLIAIDPAHNAEYIANRDRYLHELEAVDAYIHTRLDRYTKHRVFMTDHPAFGYFAAEYNLTQIAIEHEGKELTPKVIRECIDQAGRHNLSYVYAAPQRATKDVDMIAHEIGGQTVFIDPLPLTYSVTLRSTADSLAMEME